jgi:CheY-like chemotaxis protein
MKITYVDDTPEELERYTRRLSDDGLVVNPMPPPSPFDPAKVYATRADLYVLDYELEKVSKTYEGATLATAIRQQFSEHPIVLLSKRSLVQPARTRPLALLFDEILYKDELDRQPTAGRRRIISIGEGFATLRSKRRRDVDALLAALGARKAEEHEVLRAVPPLDIVSDTQQWSVREIAEWIRRDLLAYPGVFYDETHAATVLGVDVSTFRSQRVQALFASSKYDGVFADLDPRWWRSRLLAGAHKIAAEAGVGPGASQLVFPAALRRKRLRIRLSTCVFCGEHGPEAVCYVLDAPVHIEHSLAYRPDARSGAMDEARASFKAIQETDRVVDEYLAEEDRVLAEQLRNE